MWAASDKTQDTKEKVLALSLAKEVYSMKLDLLGNVYKLETAMKFRADYKENNGRREMLQKSLVSNDENGTNDFSTNDIEEETTTTNKVF